MVRFTVNEGMSDDTPCVSVNLRQTTTPGTTSASLGEQCVGSLTSHRIYMLGSLRNDDGKGNENGKKPIDQDWQNNNLARVSRFFVHFVAVVARLQRERA